MQQQLLPFDDRQFRLRNGNAATQQRRHYMGIPALVKSGERKSNRTWCAAQSPLVQSA
jgi:hypothetical protein